MPSWSPVSPVLCLALSASHQSSIPLAATNSDKPLSERVVAHDIDARVDTRHHTIDGFETLTYRNLTGKSQNTFPFPLYQNAFQPKSTFMTEMQGSRPSFEWKEKYRASSEINSLEVVGVGDLSSQVQFISPDDGNPDDRTIFQVKLRVVLDRGGPEKTGYWLRFGALLLTTFVLMSPCLWFDMAQVRTAVEDEWVMRRPAAQAFRLTSPNFGLLFWLYLRISLRAWVGLALGVWLGTQIPGQHSGLSFLVCELVLLGWIGTRLWQRASEMAWYQRRALAVPAAAPVVETAPPPESPMGSLPKN